MADEVKLGTIIQAFQNLSYIGRNAAKMGRNKEVTNRSYDY